MFKHRLKKRWYDKKPPPFGLVPLSYIYQAIILIRQWLYRHHVFATTHLPVPVIVVGNLTLGGNGKTPLVAWLAHRLRQEGFNPGLISRGYGGKSKAWPEWVLDESDPHLVGDEAVMLVKQTHCPMVVGPNRVKAAQTLLKKYSCDVIISDDGLQHLALGRDLEIVVEGSRNFGNGYCLPGGPMREPITRINTVDFFINHTTMQLKPGPFRNIKNPNLILTTEDLSTKKIHAVAGIGHPERFFQLLKDLEITFTPHSFPDHHLFTETELQFGKDCLIIMTEKDAIKCRKFADEYYWYLPIQLELEEVFVTQFKNKFMEIVKEKYSVKS